MGAAQSNMRPSGVVLPVSYLGELGSEIRYEKSMGNSRFLKSIKARHGAGALVIKVFVKLDSYMDLRPTSKRIAAERAALADCVNVLPYSYALATERAGYLLRQWLSSSLYDRISTRPFLSMVEKKWIAFQLLTALKDVHARKVAHGDIKSENVLVTSWNWVYLSDFAGAFKPTYLPEDDPSDFSYFYDTSGRRTCYIAPERFYGQNSDISRRKATLDLGRSLGKVTEAMDVFSLGCVLAELFLEGTAPFTLAQLLKYRSGEYSLEAYLHQIEDQEIRLLIKSMLSLDPSDRSACEDYLAQAYGTLFPASFYDFLHDFVASANEAQAGPATTLTASNAGQSVSGLATPDRTAMGPAAAAQMQDTESQVLLPSIADEIIGRIWTDYEDIQRHLCGTKATDNPDDTPHSILSCSDSLFPVLSELIIHDPTSIRDNPTPPTEDGPPLLISSVICSNMRNCASPSSISKALDLLLALSKHLTDETKLDRLLPSVVACLQYDHASVRASALRTLTQLLLSTDTITPANATIFTEYVLPNIQSFPTDPDELVRAMLAQSLAALAECGQKFLDMTQAMKAEGTFKLTRGQEYDGAPYEVNYESSLLDLQSQIQDIVNNLLIDPSPAVRRALVLHITPLCAFLGRSRTSDVLGLMTTHLNDRDWRLRSQFFASMVGVATCISIKSVDQYILPLLVESLSDSEELVAARELSTLSTLTSLGVHSKGRLWDTLAAVLPLLYHPNIWIRTGASNLITISAQRMSEAERWCSLYPALRKFLRADISAIDDLSILSACPLPISRPVYEASVAWASRATTSNMWQVKPFAKGMDLLGYIENLLHKPDLSVDDQSEMQRLNTLGMLEDDSLRLLSMRPYIKRISAVRKNLLTSNDGDIAAQSLSFTDDITLVSLGVTPQNIIFSPTDNFGARLLARSLQPGGLYYRNGSGADLQAGLRSADSHRTSGLRSASGSSTADALRRRLALNNRSSSSLVSNPVAGISRQPSLSANKVIPPSPASAVNSERSSSLDQREGEPSEPALNTATPTVVSNSNLSKQRSRVNLHGVEVSKVSAAVSADVTVATGVLTSELSHEMASQSGLSAPAHSISRIATRPVGGRFSSTYEGDDPAIRQLLDRVYLDSYREPMPEFGAFVSEKPARRRNTRPGTRERVHKRPEGILIGHLAEHIGGVTSIAVSPDHLFFATGSADGTTKIWDTTRLEKNVTSRSRQTVAQGGVVTCVIVLENSHCVASASDNGSIWINRVDLQQTSGQMPRYGKPAIIRQHLVDSLTGDYATCLLHYDTDSASKLLYGTMQARIVILDVRTLRILTIFEQPTHLGPISCMCLDKKRSWLLTGTQSGYLVLWDLRFGLLISSWKAGSDMSGAVTSCAMHATRGRGRWVVVTIDGHDGCETYDLESGICVERYMLTQASGEPGNSGTSHRRTTSSAGSRADPRMHSAKLEVPDTAASAIERLLSESTSKAVQPTEPDPASADDPASALHGYAFSPSRPSIMTAINGSEYPGAISGTGIAGGLPVLSEVNESTASPALRNRAAESGWLITAGEDKTVRFWDLAHVDRSSVVVSPDEAEDKFALTTVKGGGGSATYLASRIPNKHASSNAKRPNLTATGQQNYLRAHQDAITSLALLDLPFRCIVSADRSGIVKVWE